jgi:hypothetical protein
MTFYGLAIAVLIGESSGARQHELCVDNITAIDRGMGQHVDRVIWLHGPEGLDNYNLVCLHAVVSTLSNQITNVQQAIYVCALTYNTTLGFVKLSVISLYHRILQGVPSKTLLILNWCVFGLVACNTTINVFIAAFQCNPVHAAFDSNIKGTCINTSAFYLGNAITGIITELMVYLLSIPIVRPFANGQQAKDCYLDHASGRPFVCVPDFFSQKSSCADQYSAVPLSPPAFVSPSFQVFSSIPTPPGPWLSRWTGPLLNPQSVSSLAPCQPFDP